MEGWEEEEVEAEGGGAGRRGAVAAEEEARAVRWAGTMVVGWLRRECWTSEGRQHVSGT